MNYAFVIVNFNNSLLTISCIESILFQKQIVGHINIIIVDNNSNDTNKNLLLDWQYKHPDSVIYVLFLKLNIGYFPAINKGLEVIEKLIDQDFIIIGNNDLIFNEFFLNKLSKTLYSNNIFVIAPNIIRSDGLHQNPFFKTKVSGLRKFYYKIYYVNYYFAFIIESFATALKLRKIEKDKPDYDKNQFIYMGFGACYVLTKSFIKECQGLKDDVFLFGEEAMLGYQVERHNGKIFYDSSLLVNHLDHSTLSKIPSKKMYRIAKASYNIYKHYL
jgi:GT2 family glycosyltransferase